MPGEEVPTKKQVEIYALDFDGYSDLEYYCPQLNEIDEIDGGRNAESRAKWLVDVYNCALYNSPETVQLDQVVQQGQIKKRMGYQFKQEALLKKFAFLNDIKASMGENKQIKIMIGSNRQGLRNERLNTFGDDENPRNFGLSCRTCLSLLQKVIDSKEPLSKDSLVEVDYIDETVEKTEEFETTGKVIQSQAEEWRNSGPPERDGRAVTQWKDLAEDGNIRIERLTHEMLAKYNGDMEKSLARSGRDNGKVLQNIFQMHAAAAINEGQGDIIFNFQDDREDITDSLYKVFSANPQVIPAGVTLRIKQRVNGKEKAYEDVEGTGPIVELKDMARIMGEISVQIEEDKENQPENQELQAVSAKVSAEEKQIKDQKINEIYEKCLKRGHFFNFGNKERSEELKRKLKAMNLEDVKAIGEFSKMGKSTKDLDFFARQLVETQGAKTSRSNVDGLQERKLLKYFESKATKKNTMEQAMQEAVHEHTTEEKDRKDKQLKDHLMGMIKDRLNKRYVYRHKTLTQLEKLDIHHLKVLDLHTRKYESPAFKVNDTHLKELRDITQDLVTRAQAQSEALKRPVRSSGLENTATRGDNLMNNLRQVEEGPR